MARGINTHHDGTDDIYEINGMVLIDKDTTGHYLDIDVGGQLANYKGALNIYSNVAQIGTDVALLRIISDNASTTKPAVDIRQDGTGGGVLIDQDGNGIGLSIDSEATSNPCIRTDMPKTNGTYMTQHRIAGGNRGGFVMADAVNDDVVLLLGRYYLWADVSGTLRIQAQAEGIPTGDFSGTIVGTQS